MMTIVVGAEGLDEAVVAEAVEVMDREEVNSCYCLTRCNSIVLLTANFSDILRFKSMFICLSS